MKSPRSYLLKALYDWILDSSCTPFIVLQADGGDVEVPDGYVENGRIVLNISPASIRDLVIGESELSFDGRFGGRAQRVVAPTGRVVAIYAKENGQGMQFETETSVRGSDAPPPRPEAPPTGPKLTRVK